MMTNPNPAYWRLNPDWATAEYELEFKMSPITLSTVVNFGRETELRLMPGSWLLTTHATYRPPFPTLFTVSIYNLTENKALYSFALPSEGQEKETTIVVHAAINLAQESMILLLAPGAAARETNALGVFSRTAS